MSISTVDLKASRALARFKRHQDRLASLRDRPEGEGIPPSSTAASYHLLPFKWVDLNKAMSKTGCFGVDDAQLISDAVMALVSNVSFRKSRDREFFTGLLFVAVSRLVTRDGGRYELLSWNISTDAVRIVSDLFSRYPELYRLAKEDESDEK